MAQPAYDLDVLRADIPLLRHAIPFNSCSQGPLTTQTRAGVERFLASWEGKGMDWEGWLVEVEMARKAFAWMINATADDVAVFSSVSHATSAVASALRFDAGREVVVASGMEFPAVGQIWRAQEGRGAQLRWVQVENGAVALDAYSAAIDERTAVVSSAHAWFQNGVVQDVGAIARLAHAHGAYAFVDAYQSLGVVPVDVQELEVDFLASGTLKYLMGTPGVAFLYVRPAIVERLEPFVTGWFGRVNPFTFDVAAKDWAATARRFDGGTPPLLPIYASRAGLDLLRNVGLGEVHEWTQHLRRRMEAGARARGFAIHGPGVSAAGTPMVAVELPDAHRLEGALRGRGILASARGPAVRLAAHYFNSEADVDQALDTLVELTAP